MEFTSLHEWNLSPREAVGLQKELVSRLDTHRPLRRFRWIAAADVSFSAETGRQSAAVVVVDWRTGEAVEKRGLSAPAAFPYVPGLLSFREIPLLLRVFRRLKTSPDVVLCDGQGIAHPRRLGLAAHLGLWLQLPTIGCAKTRLYGRYEEPPQARGGRTPLMAGEERIGEVVRTRSGVKPVFVSPGHRCDQESAVRVVLETATRYRLPDPIRLAHQYSNEVRLRDKARRRTLH